LDVYFVLLNQGEKGGPVKGGFKQEEDEFNNRQKKKKTKSKPKLIGPTKAVHG